MNHIPLKKGRRRYYAKSLTAQNMYTCFGQYHTGLINCMYTHIYAQNLIVAKTISALKIHNLLCAWQIVMKESRMQKSFTAIFDLLNWKLIHTDT